jgi:hypothetical protein
MSDEFTKARLVSFIDSVAIGKGLVNPNTGAGWKAACSRILENVQDGDDVRNIDLKTEVRRYNNSHPGILSPSSLQQYEKRLVTVINQFVEYANDPAKYKGHGRPVGEGPQKKIEPRKNAGNTTGALAAATASAPSAATLPSPIAGLSLDYPLRPDFLVQVKVPRDLTQAEARRIQGFILTLAQDYQPT